jgi:two-component system sensor histidine kinase KdpD
MTATTPSGRIPSSTQQHRVRVWLLLTRLGMRHPQRRAAGYGVAITGTVALTLGFLAFRDATTPLSKGFGFLIVVVAAAATGGLGPGILASLLGSLSFNFFFLPPYGTFVVARAEDVVVLFVFLGLSILISALLARATERAEAAETREQELRTLQALSAELVALIPGPGSYQAILSRLLGLFGFAAAALYVNEPDQEALREQVTVGAAPGALPPDPHLGGEPPAPERLPLSAGGRALGVLVLGGERPPLDVAERRVLRAFCDQFALVLERDRLLHTATEAEAYRRTEQVRRSLLAAVSHDLRSPLAAIKASVTDLLGHDVEHGADEAREALDSIDKETDRLGAHNAAKAAAQSRNREIEVHAEHAGTQATVRIVDHGPGVPNSIREQLFYPFYQPSERHPRLGTGLGLAISKGFLALMHGQIWIEDTKGGGATFAFSLPTGAAVR